MEDNSGGQKRPVRTPSNKIKDLYNAYVKNEGSKTIPINVPGQDKNKTNDDNNENTFDSLTDAETALIEEISRLNDVIDEFDKENSDLKDRMVRSAAEFENFKKRSIREKQDLIDYANERLIIKLLPLIDDLGNACDAGKNGNDYNALLKGLEMINSKALKILDEVGVKNLESSVGKPFNVDFHDAMMKIPSEFPENYVIQEIQSGYKFNDKVIRHSKVITSAGETYDNNGDNE